MAQENKNNQNAVVKGSNEYDLKIVEAKNKSAETNAHDVEIKKVQLDIEKLKIDKELRDIESRREYEKYQAELMNNTKRIEIYTNAAKGVILGGMVLTWSIIAKKGDIEVRKHEIEFGRD